MKAVADRLVSLDVFRGITIAAMVLVNSPGNETAYKPLRHAAWHGLTPTDLIFPFFVVIVGVSLTLSFDKRRELGQGRGRLLAQILKRTAVIFLMGIILNGFPHYRWESIRIPGVLQRIALCYFAGSLLALFAKRWVQIAAFALILGGYAWLMTNVNVPGHGAGVLTPEGNLAAYLDRRWLGAHLYKPHFDPEGILSTLPAVGTVLMGMLTGWWLKSGWDRSQKVTGLLQAGVIALLVGWRWHAWFPVNKALWTSSYVLVTGGFALLTFALCYWWIDVRGRIRGTRVFEALGWNALEVYFLHILVLKIQNLIKFAQPDGTTESLRLWISNHLFAGWLSRPNASLAYAIGYTLLWTGVCWMLYRRRIVLKI